MTWLEDNEWEGRWWNNCVNTLREEFLQFSYAKRMGLETFYDGRSPYNIDMKGKSVLDIGGGPISLLLKCQNVRGYVADPCYFPFWVGERYRAAGINYTVVKGEDVKTRHREFDEVWIYNVLQHTVSPTEVLINAMHSGKIIRIFEWIDAGISPGHPHELKEELLNEWLGGKGTVEMINEHGAVGKCYYGVFNGFSERV